MRALFLATLMLPSAVAGQDTVGVTDPVTDSLAALYPTVEWAAPVPFGPGERMSYRVEMLWFDVGEGHMSVLGIDTVQGQETYRAAMGYDAGAIGFSARDTFTTFFDIGTLQSWRFVKKYNGSYTSSRHYEMLPGEGIWRDEDREPDHDEHSGELGSALPLDDISFIYFLRQMDLEVGRTYTLSRYFKQDGNPVVIKVLRRERRKVDAGEFDCIVVQPIVKTDGIFSEGGKAEIYLSDDERRVMVYMKTNIPRVPGALELYLTGYRPGVPLHPDARRAAVEARVERAEEAGGGNR